MGAFFYSLAMVMLFVFWTGSTEAVPIVNSTVNLVDKSERSASTIGIPILTSESINPTETINSTSERTSLNSRQLVVNSNVPTAATGLNSGSIPGIQNPLQALTLLQQVTNSGNNPLAVQAELQAQKQESIQLQNQKQQQSLLAVVQTQQDQVSTAQAAITNQSQMANGQHPGSFSLAALNPATQQLQGQLEQQKQQLLVKQQLLKQQINPELQQLSPQQILISQILNEPASKRPQLLEQIKQTQTKQQAQNLINASTVQQQTPGSHQSTRAQQELMRYQTLIQLLGMAQMSGNPNRLGYNIDPTRSGLPTLGAAPMIADGSMFSNVAQMQQLRQAQQVQEIKELLLLQRQQQMMALRHQMAMMNPFAF